MEQDRYQDIIRRLIDHYGLENEWATDHLKHYHTYLMIIAVHAHDDFFTPFNSKINETRSKRSAQTSLAGRLLDQSKEIIENLPKVMDANVEKIQEAIEKSDEKIYLAGLVVTDAESNHASVMEEFNRGRVNEGYWIKKNVGRPARSKYLYELMDHLRSEMGSNNKVIEYIIDNPIFKGENTETLKREYRKYRKSKEEGGG